MQIEADTPHESSPAARVAAALASVDTAEAAPAEQAPEGQPETPAAATGEQVATPETPATPAAEVDPYDPAELRRIAAERAQAQQKPEPKPEPAQPAAPAFDMKALADAVAQPGREREAVEHLAKTGDLSKLSELTGLDAGTLTEKIMGHGLEPGSVKLEAELANTRAELAELKRMITGEDASVVTRDGLDSTLAQRAEEQRLQSYQGQLTADYERTSADAERFPLQAKLGKLDQDAQMRYALEADRILVASGRDRFSITATDIAEVTERELRKLAQTFGGPGAQQAGKNTAAGTATDTSITGARTLSNTNASETVAAPADIYDMQARKKRAMAALDE